MFTTVRAKFGNMRKESSFTLCPGSGGRVILQSEKRIAELLSAEVVLLSDGKGGHPGFHKLSRDFGAREFPVDRGLGETIIALAQQSLGPVVVALSGAVKPEEPLFYWAYCVDFENTVWLHAKETFEEARELSQKLKLGNNVRRVGALTSKMWSRSKVEEACIANGYKIGKLEESA